MTANFWTSSQYKFESEIEQSKLDIAIKNDYLVSDPVVYIVNAIDSLSDLLPRFVRSNFLHYTAIVLAQRYMYLSTETSPPVLDGEMCCNIACTALWVACESDGRLIPSQTWDAAVSKIFPCEVVHRGVWSTIEFGRKIFVSTLRFNLHVHHPFDTLGLLLSEISPQNPQLVTNIALGAINSLYRTTAVIEYPPYVIAIATVCGALLITGQENGDIVASLLDRTPVDHKAVEKILCTHLLSHILSRELPPEEPPKLEHISSPSSRASRSVSRHSSRAISSANSSSNTSMGSSSRRNRSCKRTISTPMAAVPEDVSWALYPSAIPPERTIRSQLSRPVTLSELRILREISSCLKCRSIVKLVEVEIFSPNEESAYKSSFGQNLILNGFFDSNGTQFDSVSRLMGGDKSRLIDLIEQLVSAVHFLNENKICHFGLEPRNLMVSDDTLKIASLSTASILPTVPTTPPSHEYRSPELLIGVLSPREDDPLAVDLWSLGCVIAELARIFATRNRYEDPIFALNSEADGLPEKPESKAPIHDRTVYTDARYVLRIASVLNGGMLPPVDVWPNINMRQHFDKVTSLMEYSRKKNPTKFGSHGIVGNGENTLQQYCKEDSSDAIVTEIVKALLRWSPEKRATPRMILQRIGKHRISNKTYI